MAGGHVDVVDRLGRGQRRVLVAQDVGVLVLVDVQRRGIGRLVGRQHLRAAAERAVVPALEAQATQATQAVAALVEHEVVVEQLDVLDQHLRIVRDQRTPARAVADAAIVHRHHAVVGCVPVGEHHPAPADVVGAVVEVRCARGDRLELAGGGGRGQHALLVVLGAAQVDHHVCARAASTQARVAALVGLVVHHHVARGIGADDVTLDAAAAQRGGVVLHVEQRLVVGGPDDVAAGARDLVGQQLPGGQVADADHVLAAAGGVLGVSQPVLRVAHRAVGDRIEALAGGQLVDVQQHLLGCVGPAAVPHVDRVLLARLVARGVPVAVGLVRHRGLVLLHPRLHLGEQLLLERLVARAVLLVPGVLGPQVVEHRRALARVVAQPVVVVVARAVGRFDGMRMDRGHRRAGHRGGRAGRIRGDRRRGRQRHQER